MKLRSEANFTVLFNAGHVSACSSYSTLVGVAIVHTVGCWGKFCLFGGVLFSTSGGVMVNGRADDTILTWHLDNGFNLS